MLKMTRNNLRDENQVDSQLRKKRKQEAAKNWKEDPINEYHDNQSLTTVHTLREKMMLNRFEEFLLESERIPADVNSVRDVIKSDIQKFLDYNLDPDPNIGDRTLIDYLSTLSKFYNVLVDNNVIGSNPVKNILSEERKNRDWGSPDRPFIPFNHMKRYLNWLDTPFARAFILTGLKTSSRSGEAINIDLRCCNIDHPIFHHLLKKYDVTLDPRIRDKPDSILIYAEFNTGDEIPNENTPGPEVQGEVRSTVNKRKEVDGSIIPVDSELKTALVEYLFVRPTTTALRVQPLFTNEKQKEGGTCPSRLGSDVMRVRLFSSDTTPDSAKQYGQERALDTCPDCGGSVIEWNSVDANKTGRIFECQECNEEHRRAIMWDHGLDTEQKITYHLFRHYFSDGHRVGSSQLHNGELIDRIRQHRIRGDRDSGNADRETYQNKQNQDWEKDVREPYLDAIYKFGLYRTVIPAVGEK